MNTEKTINPPSGYLAFILFLFLLLAGALCIMARMQAIGVFIIIIDFCIILPGLAIVNPNESKVLTFFGKYVGTVKQDGFFWVNPYTVKRKVSLRAFNLN